MTEHLMCLSLSSVTMQRPCVLRNTQSAVGLHSVRRSVINGLGMRWTVSGGHELNNEKSQDILHPDQTE